MGPKWAGQGLETGRPKRKGALGKVPCPTPGVDLTMAKTIKRCQNYYKFTGLGFRDGKAEFPDAKTGSDLSVSI